MTADEMLEEVGYKIAEDSKRYLKRYQNKHGGRINFNLVDKAITCIARTKRGETQFRYFTMDELKAIYQKCKELGWIE